MKIIKKHKKMIIKYVVEVALIGLIVAGFYQYAKDLAPQISIETWQLWNELNEDKHMFTVYTAMMLATIIPFCYAGSLCYRLLVWCFTPVKKVKNDELSL